jgi:hypothetical protein
MLGVLCSNVVIPLTVFPLDADSSKIDYVLFTGISSMVTTLAFILIYLFDWEDNALMRITELIVNLLWWVFWLTAAIVTSTINDTSRLQASCAFSWMTWVIWNASCVQSFVAHRASKGAS